MWGHKPRNVGNFLNPRKTIAFRRNASSADPFNFLASGNVRCFKSLN
jgi:hypothetical protein